MNDTPKVKRANTPEAQAFWAGAEETVAVRVATYDPQRKSRPALEGRVLKAALKLDAPPAPAPAESAPAASEYCCGGTCVRALCDYHRA